MNKKLFLIVIAIIILVIAAILRLGGKTGQGNTENWSIESELKALSALFGRQIPENPLPLPPVDEEPATPEPAEPSKSPLGVQVLNPAAGEPISSPYTIRGKAHGSWFFEAVLPVELVDEEGKVLVRTYGTALGDWMVDGMVEFESRLEFDPGDSKKGQIIIRKDNPSGLPENDGSASFPVLFR